jgi:peptide/nickel transport system permease protein
MNETFAARARWGQVGRQRLPRVGLLFLVAIGLTALLADLLASDLPLLLRLDGTTYLLPNLRRPPALRAYDNQRLRRELTPARGDWAWMPPCEYGPEQQPTILRDPPASPDRDHWLGTDDRGRDVFARLVHGARVSLLVGLLSVALYLIIGLALGVCGGFLGGRVDWIVSRLIELGLTFPTFFLILVIMALQERTSLLTMITVLGLTRWTDVARLARAEVLRLKTMDFILAARASGAGPLRIMVRHLIPNALGPVLVNATFGVAGAILVESGLSFLGFGVPPPTASWGEVLSQAVEHQDRWWLTVCPGALLFLTVTALNLVGEGLRDAIDPRLRDHEASTTLPALR